MNSNEQLNQLEHAIAERGRRQVALPEVRIRMVNNFITNFHNVLRAQAEPVYTAPEHSINGWELLYTTFERQGELHAIPTSEILGSRAIYLSTDPGEILRVLSVPDENNPPVSSVLAIQPTTIPDLLVEDPSLIQPLTDTAWKYVNKFNLRIR